MRDVPGQIAFYSLAVLTLGSALAVVRSRSVVHAGFWLLPCFVGVAGLFAALEAHFFFVVQLLIYAGAILVLILFALMLTRDAMGLHSASTNRMGLWAPLIAGGLAIVSAAMLVQQPWPVSSAHPLTAEGQTRALGQALIGLYAVPFEVASLLLLAALIGAVVLAKADRGPEPELPPLGDLAAVEVREPVGVE